MIQNYFCCCILYLTIQVKIQALFIQDVEFSRLRTGGKSWQQLLCDQHGRHEVSFSICFTQACMYRGITYNIHVYKSTVNDCHVVIL